jgi:hypothetical protein
MDAASWRVASTPPAGPENIARAGKCAASRGGRIPRLERSRRNVPDPIAAAIRWV